MGMEMTPIMIMMCFFIICVSSLNVKESSQNLLTEPKHIGFLSQLLLLFTFCHTCKANKPEVSARQEGTMAVVTTTCHNPACKRQVCTWRSQPNIPGTQIAAGNFLSCFAILLAGASPSKVIQIFLHMGLGCVTLRTFFRYQRVRSIQKNIHWPLYSRLFIFQAWKSKFFKTMRTSLLTETINFRYPGYLK